MLQACDPIGAGHLVYHTGGFYSAMRIPARSRSGLSGKLPASLAGVGLLLALVCGQPPVVAQAPAATPQTACGPPMADPRTHDLVVLVEEAQVFVRPQALTIGPIAVAKRRIILIPTDTEGEWYLIRYDSPRFGDRFGYVHCRDVAATPAVGRADATAPTSAAGAPPVSKARREPENRPSPTPTANATPPPLAGARSERHSGYLEWRQEDHFVVDGQRVRWHEGTRVRAEGFTSLEAIPLGYEVSFRGVRLTDGSILADELQAKPNGIASFEREVKAGTDELERIWTQAGGAFLYDGKARHEIGRIIEAGPRVERVRRIVDRLVPAYVPRQQVRVRVIDSDEWNARAMDNGAIWVYRGLMDDTSDDELAIVLGHELAHYTHEHSRRGTRNAFWVQFVNAVAGVAIAEISDVGWVAGADLARFLSLNAWHSSYGRNLEDQADRVGLRYAYEAGFDITRGPPLWERMHREHGQLNRVASFFFGSHSRPTERQRNLERELQINYRLAVGR